MRPLRFLPALAVLLPAYWLVFPAQAEQPAPVPSRAGPVSVATAPSLSPATGKLVDALNQTQLQEAFRLLRSGFIKREQLTYEELNRAALQGVLDRLESGAMLLTPTTLAEADSPYPFHAQKLGQAVCYVRPGRFNADEIPALDGALAEFLADAKLQTLILDLRSPQPLANFETAAALLGRFRPPGELLFKVTRPGDPSPRLFVSKSSPKSWDRQLLVLIDRETGNSAEIIAAVLQRKSKSLVFGERTPGLTVEYEDVPLATDRILRYAVAEVLLADDVSLFRKGVIPDIPVPSTIAGKHVLYRDSEHKDILDLIHIPPRPQVNEAALVSRTNPELDYYLAKSNKKPTPWDKPPVQDRVLHAALDLLTVSAFLAP